MKRVLLNPLVLFLGIWSLVFYLFSWHASEWLVNLDSQFILAALLTGLFAVLGYALGYYFLPLKCGRTRGPIVGNINGLLVIVKTLFLVMCIILPIEVIASGGIPVLWMLTGSSKEYVDYGIPTLHGFFNAILLFEGTVCFWLIATGRASTLVKIIFLVCFALPIAAISRQVSMSLIAQCFVVFVAARLRRGRVGLVPVLFIVLLTLILFSVVGTVRTDSTLFKRQSALASDYEWMPIAALWPYMYLTTPVNNFAHITSLDIAPTWGYSSLANLTPSVLKELIWGPRMDPSQFLVTLSFNVTSYATPLYMDFGWLGVILFTFFQMLVSGLIFRLVIQGNSLYNVLLLAFFDQAVILSFFVNFFLLGGVAFQIVLILLLRKLLVPIDASYEKPVRVTRDQVLLKGAVRSVGPADQAKGVTLC